MPKSRKRVKKRRRGEQDEHKQFQGSMSSMRSGFQKLTGTKKEQKQKKQDSGFRFIAVLILIAVAILVVWGIAR